MFHRISPWETESCGGKDSREKVSFEMRMEDRMRQRKTSPGSEDDDGEVCDVIDYSETIFHSTLNLTTLHQINFATLTLYFCNPLTATFDDSIFLHIFV